MLLFVYTTTRKRFVIFKCRYFKLLVSWNTSALSQSNCRNFSCSSIRLWIEKIHTVSSLQSWRILKREQWYHFQDKCSPAAFPSFLSFFICFQDCGCDQCTSEFSLKQKKRLLCALSATSGFLDSSSVCFSRQESNVSDAPAGELQFSCENMRPAAVSLVLKNSFLEFLLCAVDHQSNNGYKSTVLIHIFHECGNVPVYLVESRMVWGIPNSI